MIRQAPRCLVRSPIPSLRLAPTRRFLSTAPPAQKSRSWKNKATRLGLAVGAIYYYNTSTLFAEEPPFAVPAPSSASDETSLPTLESVKLDSQRNSAIRSTTPPASTEPETFDQREEEASQEGAFNEETGEINWDCPCLGGMAHGPCGEQFRAAFSCFVFSKEEPKGMDCIGHFKEMQDCFREHPDIYGSELEGDDDDAPPLDESASSPIPSPAPTTSIDSVVSSLPAAATSATPEPQSLPSSSSSSSSPDTLAGTTDTERARAATQQVERDHGDATSESDELVPKAAHDAVGAGAGK